MRTIPSSTGAKRVVFAAADGADFTRLRGSLIEDAARLGHTVLCMASHFEPPAQTQLDRIGVAHLAVRFAATGYNPLAAYGVRRELQNHVAAFCPDVAVACDARSFPSFAAAAAAARVPSIVPLLNVATRSTRIKADKQLRAALAHVTSVVVETLEERRLLESLGWLQPGVQILAAPSCGLDLHSNPVQPLPPLGAGFVFLLVSAIDDAAASAVFAAAGARVTSRSPSVKLAHGTTHEAIAAAHVLVHASATPGPCQALLTGLAMGRPIITTDVATARDTVDERVNGCRVTVGDAAAVAEAMQSFLRRMDLVPAMARASRLKAERRYDYAEVSRLTLQALGLAGDSAAAA